MVNKIKKKDQSSHPCLRGTAHIIFLWSSKCFLLLWYIESWIHITFSSIERAPIKIKIFFEFLCFYFKRFFSEIEKQITLCIFTNKRSKDIIMLLKTLSLRNQVFWRANQNNPFLSYTSPSSVASSAGNTFLWEITNAFLGTFPSEQHSDSVFLNTGKNTCNNWQSHPNFLP